MDFNLVFNEGGLTAVVVIDGVKHEKDVTDYFMQDNPHDEWLDYRLGLKETLVKLVKEGVICGQCQRNSAEHTLLSGARLCGVCFEVQRDVDEAEGAE